jgi:hypothetical protein
LQTLDLKYWPQERRLKQEERNNVQKLQIPSLREEFKLELKNRFLILSSRNKDTDIEASWKAIINVHTEANEKIVGFRENQQKEWISEEKWKEIETRKLVKEKVNRSKKIQQKISTQKQYSEINKRVKRSIRKDKRKWINEQAQLAEEVEKKEDIKELYNVIRKLSQRKFRMNRPVKTKSGVLLTTKEEQLKRWQKHFSEIFNQDDNKAERKQEMRNVKDNDSEN